MKNLTSKKFQSIIALTIMTIVSLILAFALTTSSNSVYASTYTTENVVMDDGASAYVDPTTSSYSGIKFKASVTSLNQDATYGMMIVPYDYFEKAEITTSSDVDFIQTFADAKTQGKITYDPLIKELAPELDGTSGTYKMEISITDILPNNYDRQFVGIAFEKVGEAYKYSAIKETTIRDIVYIASVGLDNITTESTAQIDAMKAFIAKGIENAGESYKYELTADKTSALVGGKVNLTLNVAGLRLNNPTFEVTKGSADLTPNGNTCEVTLNAWGKVEVTAKTAGGEITTSITLWATEEGEFAFMQGEDIKERFSSTGASSKTYLSTTDLQSEGLTGGDYSGNALKLTYNLATNEPVVQNIMTLIQYNALADEGYTSLYFWYAIKCDTATMRIDKDNAWLCSSGDVSYTELTWIKVSIPLSEELKGKLFDGSAVELFSVYRTNGKEVSIYLGNIGFEKTLTEGELYFIDEKVADKGTISVDAGAITSDYLTASQWAEEGITANGYTGNALKLSSTTAGSRTWKLSHILSESVYDKYVTTDGYTKLYIWFTADDPSDNRMFNAQNVPNNLVIGGSYTEKQWQKLTVTLDSTVKAKLFDGSPVELFKVYCTTGTATIYIGDIGFEK